MGRRTRGLKLDLAFAHDASGHPLSGLPFNPHLISNFDMGWSFDTSSDPTSFAGDSTFTQLGGSTTTLTGSTITQLEFQDIQLDLGVTLPSFILPLRNRWRSSFSRWSRF